MSEALEDGLFLDAIQLLDTAARYADIDDERLSGTAERNFRKH